MRSSSTIQLPEHEDSTSGLGGHGWIVTVFNNEVNTYDEVVHIMMVATRCTEQEAFIETWEIDHLGKSVVHHGSQGACDHAASVIATIGIRVEVSHEG